MMRVISGLGFALLIGVVGLAGSVGGCECGSPGGGRQDGGTTDQGVVDAGPDAGPSDGGDAGPNDAGDGGVGDAGPDGGSDAGSDAGSDGGVAVACAVLCHGDNETAAPPFELHGESDTALTGVGAHRSHLQQASWWHKDVSCNDCHLVPNAVGDPGHIDTPRPAELTWGVLATHDGANPSWDQTKCSGVYCHGGTLSDGSNTTPTWTTVDGSQARCGSCHGVPPAAPHPVVTGQCGECHTTMSKTAMEFLEPQRHIDGVVDVDLNCTSCHGDPVTGSPAPPRDTRGGMDTTLAGVGAHQSHLGASDWHMQVSCRSCHKVPSAPSDPGHYDTALPAELDYSGGIGGSNGALPGFDGTSCSNYCHGQTLFPGGLNTTPTWTQVGQGEAACGNCHSLPPGQPHPQSVGLSDCTNCHHHLNSDGLTFNTPDLHINGVIDVDYNGMGCTDCHGDPTANNPAPPNDTFGNTAPTAVGVGAHQQHLQQGSNWHEDVQCTDCHNVPSQVNQAGHLDTNRPAELSWSAKAQADGANASWDGTATSCSNYCHGQTLAGGSNTSPDWTVVDGTQDACGTCHGLPPDPPHMNRSDCSRCHPDIAADGQTFTNPAQHIDGNVDVSLDCYSCHGTVANGNNAPPVDTSGSGATTLTGVGAHQSHLGASGWHRQVNCDSCHVVPSTITAPGHMDTTLPAELDYSAGLGAANGVIPSWDRVSCTNYCHGQSLPGGSNTSPTWTTVNGTQAACGTCHGTPPDGTHVGRSDCSTCHPDVAADNVSFSNPNLHIDGKVDLVTLTCTTCHGSMSAGNAAPPKSTTGQTATTSAGVGAHQSHLSGSATHAAVACTECHTVPQNYNDAGHADSTLPAELVFGATAKAKGASASYNSSSCSNYCHGQTLAGGSNTSPVWTKVDGTQGACGTCHGLPPSAPHLQQTDCARCHPDINSDNATFSNPAQHVNGVVEVQLTCTSCHGDPATGDAAPPQDTSTGTLTSLRGVGAHQSHVTSSTWHKDIPCESCHVVPNTINAVGHRDTPLPAELDYTLGIAQADGATASFDGARCSNYCHGQSLIPGGSNLNPEWVRVDGSQAACGTCHGLPPSAPHVQMSDCSLCHLDASAAQTIVSAEKNKHINGVVDVDTGCTICHSVPQPAAGYRRQITAGADFARTSHHVSNGTTTEIVTNADCVTCHEQLQHMQLGNLPDVRMNDPDGVGVPYAYNGLGASVLGACLDCHDVDGARAYDADKNAANGNQPFSDGQSPINIATRWTAASHNVTGKAELIQDKCMACHGGADNTLATSRTTRNMHGAAFPSLLSPRIANEPVANPEERVCLACHDATPASTNIEAEFAKGTNAQTIYHHPIVDAEQSAGRSVECTDCHNPHAANNGNKLRGMDGINLAGAAVGINTAIDRQVTQYELCFKCHGDALNTGRPRTTNKRLDFQTTNSAFHPVAGPGRNTSNALAQQLLGGLTVTSILECTDCHNNEATANVKGLASTSLAGPKGPHGSTNPFVMRAAYNTNPSGPTNWNRATNALCFLCHDPLVFEDRNDLRTNFADGTKNLHQLHAFRKVGDRVSCTNCHYNTHSNEQVSTTDWEIDGQLFSTPPAGFKTRNVSFSPDVSGAGGRAKPTFAITTSSRRRSCYVSCHGKDHKPKRYIPSTAGDTDPLTIP